MTNVELEGFLIGFHAAVNSLEARIVELESRDYPTELSVKLLEIFRKSIRQSAERVDALSKEADADPNGIMRHGHLLSWVHENVHLVGNSQGNRVPRWAIAPMRSEVSRYLTDPIDILIVGGDEGGNFAYDYSLDELKGVLVRALGIEGAKVLMSDLPSNMAVFHFPFGERDNVLAHGAFFHEVGHQLDREILGISDKVASQFLKDHDKEIKDKARKVAETFLKENFGSDGSSEQKSLGEDQAEFLEDTYVNEIQSTLHNWAQEFCADLIATRILGPAYFLVVIHSPILLNNLEFHSASHPGTLLRLRTILGLLTFPNAGDFLSESGDAMDVAGFRKPFEVWKERCDKADFGTMKWLQGSTILNAELQPVVVKMAEQLAREVLTVVEKDVAEQAYSPAEFRQDIEDVMPVLDAGITINERTDCEAKSHSANRVSTIFNVGWASYLKAEHKELRDRLQKLIRKSIELSQIQATART